MKLKLLYLLICVIGILASQTLKAQTADNIMWATMKLTKSVGEKSILSLAPIVRLDENFGGYQNASIDVSYKYKFAKKWSIQALARTWFVPENTNRQFLWIDVDHTQPIEFLKMNNRVRLHWAFDLGDQEDFDFIRYQIGFSPNTDWKLKPLFAYEPWLRLNGVNELQRFRIQPGLKYTFSENMWSDLILWREISDFGGGKVRLNLWLVRLGFKL